MHDTEILLNFATEGYTNIAIKYETSLLIQHNMKQYQEILLSLPETFKTKKEAESRAEYLRIGTFAHSYVERCDKGYRVVKVR